MRSVKIWTRKKAFSLDWLNYSSYSRYMICIPSPCKKGVGGVEAEWQERPHSAPRVQRRPEEVTEGRGQLELEREVINIIIIINVIIIIIIIIIIIVTWSGRLCWRPGAGVSPPGPARPDLTYRLNIWKKGRENKRLITAKSIHLVKVSSGWILSALSG